MVGGRVLTDLRTTPRIVKPRKPHIERRSLLVVTRDVVWHETTGELTPRSELWRTILTDPGTIMVCENAPAILRDLDIRFGTFPGWQYRVTPVVRRKFRQHKTSRPTETRDVVVNFFGFRIPHGERYSTYYHYPIDTLTFFGGTVGKVWGRDVDTLAMLIEWGMDVRAFCVDNSLKVTPTSGGLASQLLRDARFFPHPRRKVPRATNDKARAHLPGNHYELFVPEMSTQKDAYYLDMSGAHHHAASSLTFPHPDRLYGRGAFRNPPESVIGRESWARVGTPKFERTIRTHGLFLLRIAVPGHLQRTTTLYPPPWLRQPLGVRLAWVYSNELPLVRRFEARIEGIEAAWTASTTDAGLNRYAKWSLQETAAMGHGRKAWLKPTLLAAYGLLAARPRAREFGYKHAVNGEAATYLSSGGPIPVEVLKTTGEQDSPIANVIARGMIEAQVRAEVLSLATTLHGYGSKVLALYADSVIISADGALPLLPPPWRIKTELTRLEFFNPVSFASDQMIRLPGIPRDAVDRMSRRAQVRAITGAVRRGRITLPKGLPWRGLTIHEETPTRRAREGTDLEIARYADDLRHNRRDAC